MRRARRYGFTLIELMTVVVVIGILVAVAYPSYQDHVRKAKRAEGKTALLKAAQVLERAYSDNNVYPTDLGPLFGRPANNPVYSGENPAGGAYCITVAVVAATSTYTLTATPSGAAAHTAPCVALNGGFDDPAATGCANLTLTNTGARGQTGTKPTSFCW